MSVCVLVVPGFHTRPTRESDAVCRTPPVTDPLDYGPTQNFLDQRVLPHPTPATPGSPTPPTPLPFPSDSSSQYVSPVTLSLDPLTTVRPFDSETTGRTSCTVETDNRSQRPPTNRKQFLFHVSWRHTGLDSRLPCSFTPSSKLFGTTSLRPCQWRCPSPWYPMTTLPPFEVSFLVSPHHRPSGGPSVSPP